MERVFGEAADYWRLRLLRLDESDEPDLEWRDDILYRRPPAHETDEHDTYVVDAVSLDDEDRAVRLATFGESEVAHSYLERAQTDLAEMTKAQFERAYFTESAVED